MINLNNYGSNAYSCGGEDGIIEFLLGYLDERTGFVIEFGAADGLHCSNTAKLWRGDRSVDALLIESNPALFEQLDALTANDGTVMAINAEVLNIDDYTRRVADVCSIDVDGNDYQIASRMRTPHQIVVIEHNPTVPPHVEMTGIEGSMYGSSALSILKMMNEKGYTLVAVTKTNMIFLYGDHSEVFETRLEVLFDYSSLNYVVTSYDGFYDYIGEFGYGFNRPANMRLKAPGLISPTVDATTKEYMRQMVHIIDSKGD
jgi:hypothetical protein